LYSIVEIYKKAATKARMAAAPPTATELRLAALPVGEAVGKAVVGIAVVALDDGVGATTVVVKLDMVVGTTTVTEVVVLKVVEVVDTSVVTGAEEAEEEDEVVAGAAVVADGMLKVTPNWAQSPLAASIVCPTSAGVQAFSTHGVKAAMKPEALQTQAMSVWAQLVLPMDWKAQVRAHCGIFPI
jgi:hypothetical protein